MNQEDIATYTYKANGRIWIEKNGAAFLGYGRVELLEKIKELGSINKASKSMGMSYQQAWHLLSSINKGAKSPLVVMQRGGKGGGSALLTPEGEQVIEDFKQFNQRFQDFLLQESLKFGSMI